jgi:hypothetical protein
MIPLFLGLTLANLACLMTTAALGYTRSADPAAAQRHVALGFVSAILCCAVHCVAFTYFIATAKWVRHAVALRSLDPSLLAPTRSFKAQAFPAALASMLAVFIAAVTGAAAENFAVSPAVHHAAALAALAVNVLSAAAELLAIRRNGALIDRVLALAGPPTSENLSGAPDRPPLL